MSMYLYNTAPLPWYPAEWNKTVLPFAVVYRMVGSDAVPTHRMLCCSESPYVTEVDGVQVIAIPPGSNHNFTHFSGNDFWHDIGSNDELANAETFGYLNPSEYEFVWCYISIYDEAGNLVYPGSTPTLIEEEEPEPEPEEFDLQSFKTGLAIYLSIRPCVFPQRSPVAFLYNGVRLPKLPELPADDVEKYPHLFISNTGLQMVAIRWASMPVVKTSGGYGNLDGVAEYLRCSYDNFGGNEWGTWEEGAISAVNSVVAPFYGNVDLYTEDGKLYLQGTNPVPVYE